MGKKLIISLFLLLPLSVSGQTFSTSTQSITESRIISDYPNSNFQNSLSVTASTSASVRKGIIAFPVPVLPSGYDYVSAEIKLYATPYAIPYNCTYEVHRIYRSVVYSDVSWNEYSFGNSWDTPGLQSGTDYETNYLTRFINVSGAVAYRFAYISSTTTTADFQFLNTGNTLNVLIQSDNCGGIDFDWTGGIAPPVLTLYYQAVSEGGGGGGGSTTTVTYDYNLSGLEVDDIFNMSSTTLSFGTLDFDECDVSSIEINPFASSSLSWGTFSIPGCLLQSGKFLLFGLNGFDTYRITNFINTSSSTLPFIMFKFISSGLVYINPVSGALINLPTSTQAFNIDVPFPTLLSSTSTIQFNVMASSSIISGITAPTVLDTTLATLELVFFFLMWGTIFKLINI